MPLLTPPVKDRLKRMKPPEKQNDCDGGFVSSAWLDAPVRLCCGQRHFGPVCPDGMVMCCLCFERVPQAKLNVAANGQKEDVCNECAKKEGEFNDRAD
jgi:hypothetical protein